VTDTGASRFVNELPRDTHRYKVQRYASQLALKTDEIRENKDLYGPGKGIGEGPDRGALV